MAFNQEKSMVIGMYVYLGLPCSSEPGESSGPLPNSDNVGNFRSMMFQLLELVEGKLYLNSSDKATSVEIT